VILGKISLLPTESEVHFLAAALSFFPGLLSLGDCLPGKAEKDCLPLPKEVEQCLS